MRQPSPAEVEKFSLLAARVGATSGENEVINAYKIHAKTPIGIIHLIADSKAEVVQHLLNMLNLLDKGDDIRFGVSKLDHQ
jgi:hypothetical protein